MNFSPSLFFSMSIWGACVFFLDALFQKDPTSGIPRWRRWVANSPHVTQRENDLAMAQLRFRIAMPIRGGADMTSEKNAVTEARHALECAKKEGLNGIIGLSVIVTLVLWGLSILLWPADSTATSSLWLVTSVLGSVSAAALLYVIRPLARHSWCSCRTAGKRFRAWCHRRMERRQEINRLRGDDRLEQFHALQTKLVREIRGSGLLSILKDEVESSVAGVPKRLERRAYLLEHIQDIRKTLEETPADSPDIGRTNGILARLEQYLADTEKGLDDLFHALRNLGPVIIAVRAGIMDEETMTKEELEKLKALADAINDGIDDTAAAPILPEPGTPSLVTDAQSPVLIRKSGITH